jgi:4-hydroxyproline epimerase
MVVSNVDSKGSGSALPGQILSKDGQILSKDGQILSKDGQILSKDGQILSKDGQILSKDGQMMRDVAIVDSHTAGEPTRVVLEGGPDLGSGSLAERLVVFRERFDWFRPAVVHEPRGSDVIVGALLCKPQDPDCSAGVIFFNNVSYLGMCGHGIIGLVTTLAHLGRIKPGKHRIETPVGVVTTALLEDGRVTVHNVPAYRYAKNVSVEVAGHGQVTGDIAWGGNWFFLAENHWQSFPGHIST